MKLVKKINVELNRKGFPKEIDVVQYDTGLQLKCIVKDFDIPNGTTATLYAEKPSGKFVYQQKGIEISDNTIIVDLENQAITEHGKVWTQITLSNGTDTISTFEMLMKVQKSRKDSGAVESTTVIRAFDEAIEKAVAQINEARDAASKYISESVDQSLSIAGKAADAAAVGKKVTELNEKIVQETGKLSDDINRIIEFKISPNHFNIENAEVGYRCVGGGGKTTAENSILSEWVKIPDGMTYAVPCGFYNNDYRIFAYTYGFADENKNAISGSGSPITNNLAIPENAKYFRCSWLTTTTTQMLIGFNTDGSLIPYEEYKQSFSLTQEMRGDIDEDISELYERLSKLDGENTISRVVTWGDSLTDGSGASTTSKQYPSVLKPLISSKNSEINVLNAGIGGEGSKNIATRQGAIVLNVKPVTIPASGSVTIELETWHGLPIQMCRRGGNNVTSDVEKMMLNPCSIAGVTGTLLRDSSGGYIFTRSTNGNAVTIERPVPLVTYASTNLNLPTDINVFWVGTNDVNDDIEDTISVIKLMIEKTTSKKYIVIGLTSKAYHQDIEVKNQKMALAFGKHFLDIRQYILEYGLADAGIEPTEQDLTNITNGEVPSSLLVDNVHGNDYFYDIIANQVYKFGQGLAYWN